MSQNDITIKSSILNNKQFLPEVIKLINEGHTVTILLRGYSMRPFLESDRDKAVLGFPHRVRRGDAVLAEFPGKVFVLHRIVKIDGNNVTLMGDGNLSVERCRIDDIKAVVQGFYRKGRTTLDSTNGIKWKIYSFIWMRLVPIRRYLLYIHRKVFLKPTKQTVKK